MCLILFVIYFYADVQGVDIPPGGTTCLQANISVTNVLNISIEGKLQYSVFQQFIAVLLWHINQISFIYQYLMGCGSK